MGRATEDELKAFQRATVSAIVARVNGSKGGVRLALADEVGLGKTLIMAAAAKRLSRKRSIIAYVAPSLEVAHQNRESMERILGHNHSRAMALETRLTLLPAELRQRGRNGPTLICLTPNTSFNLNGTGNRRERAFLHAVFLALRRRRRFHIAKFAAVAGNRLSWQQVFYRPRGRGDAEAYRDTQRFADWVQASRSHRAAANAVAKEIASSSKDRAEIIAAYQKLVEGRLGVTAAFKKSAALVSIMRKKVAAHVLTGPYRPSIVLFDEWHRYHGLMFERDGLDRDVLRQALERWRPGSPAAPKLILFVSATPFEITFGGERDTHDGDLEQLCRLLDPGGDFQRKVDQERGAFEKAWYGYVDALISGKATKAAERTAQRASTGFSKALFSKIIRTERPTRLIELDGLRGQREMGVGDWRNADMPALHRAKRLAVDLDANSDIIGLWLSSTHYSRMRDDYQIAEQMAKSRRELRLSAKHWKREFLSALIKERWGGVPPLWIPPALAKSGKGKVLVFSAWRSVPRELTYFFHDSANAWRLKAGRTKTPLGSFPLFKRKDEREAFSLKKQGWRIFYPLLCAAGDMEGFMGWLLKSLGEPKRDSGRRSTTDWAEVLLAMDFAFAEYVKDQKAVKLSAQERERLLRKRINNWRDVLGGARDFKMILKLMTSAPRWSALPGCELMAALSTSCGPAQVFDPEQQGAILLLGKGINNYFNRVISQSIVRRHARQAFYSDAVTAYCRRFRWKEMWAEFTGLLTRRGDIEDVLSGAAESLDTLPARRTGAGWVTNRFTGKLATLVQPFAEVKASGVKADDSEQEPEGMVTTRRRVTFNSPFFPHILVSTSIGQEGIDLHRYCDTVVHWNPPESPLALEQREGRIDRYRSLQVRVAKRQLAGDGLGGERSGLSPDFCVLDEDGGRLNKTLRYVLRLPRSREDVVWQRCLERLHYSRLLLGAADPGALEAHLRKRLNRLPSHRRAEILGRLSRIRVSLSPSRR